MERKLRNISILPDELKIKELEKLLKSFFCFEKSTRSPLRNSKSLKKFLNYNILYQKPAALNIRPVNKVILPEEIRPRRKISNRTPQKKSNVYDLDQVLIIQNVFKKIGEHCSSSWIQDSGEKEYHIVIIKQF